MEEVGATMIRLFLPIAGRGGLLRWTWLEELGQRCGGVTVADLVELLVALLLEYIRVEEVYSGRIVLPSADQEVRWPRERGSTGGFAWCSSC